jgi:hypothetical protein
VAFEILNNKKLEFLISNNYIAFLLISDIRLREKLEMKAKLVLLEIAVIQEGKAKKAIWEKCKHHSDSLSHSRF